MCVNVGARYPQTSGHGNRGEKHRGQDASTAVGVSSKKSADPNWLAGVLFDASFMNVCDIGLIARGSNVGTC